MQRGILKLIVFLACCSVTAAVECISSKYNQGPRDWLQCTGTFLAEVQATLTSNHIKLSVSHSVIPDLPNLAFNRIASTLEIMHFHECGISSIGDEAFNGLTMLKQLDLSNNNISKVNAVWFYYLPSLELLDLSFNRISQFDSIIYSRLPKIQRLNLNDNLLTCISKEYMENMRQLKFLRFENNPITYFCRAQLTTWLKDHKINYNAADDHLIWQDDILWDCLSDMTLSDLATDKEVSNRKMNVCVMSKMFNQLITVLAASPSIQNSTQECVPARENLLQCLKNRNVITNGDMLMNFLALTHDAMKN